MKKLIVVSSAILVLAGCIESNTKKTSTQVDSSHHTAPIETVTSVTPSNLVKEADGTYILDQNGCKHLYNLLLKAERTIFWSGKCVNGYGSGNGTQLWRYLNGEEDEYTGELENGNRHGKGTYTWANGDKYVGDFVDGKLNGKGTLTWANGDKYVGDFVDDNLTGKGTYTWANPCSDCLVSYVGKFFIGNQHGQGKGIFRNGDEYDGAWEYGKTVGDTKFQAEKKRIQAEEEARHYERTKNCQHLYVGKIFTTPERSIIQQIINVRYIVEGFSSSLGKATIRDAMDNVRKEVFCYNIPE